MPRLWKAHLRVLLMTSFVNFLETSPKSNGIGSWLICTPKILGRIFNGVKHNSLRVKLQQSLTDCIKFHKFTVFTVEVVERLRYYLMCSIMKPVRWTIRMRISQMEVLNKYPGYSPYHQEQPFGCRHHRDGQRSIHGGYSCKYHLVTPPSCMEEPVQPNTQDSPKVTLCDASGPPEYQETLC